jgi:long-chain acyl-CoA synthetase
MNLPLAFEKSVSARPNKVALFWGEQAFTFKSLGVLSANVAGLLLAEFQVRPGDRVALWLKNCPEFIPAFFGILQAGAVVVPVNNFFKPDEAAFILNDAEAAVLITDNDLIPLALELQKRNPSLKILNVDRFSSAPSPVPPIAAVQNEKDLAVLIYTSGTTGRPKGAMLSHGNLLHNVESCRIVLQTVELDRFAVLLPMFHSYMLTVGMLLPLLVGGSMILVKSLRPPKTALLEIFHHKATVLPAIPQFYRAMVQAPIHPPLPLRMCISGAAPLPAQILKDFEEKFKIPLIEGYGLSEASPVVTKNPLNGIRKAGSIGLPIPNVTVSIQDETGRELAAHETGEVCVRGGNVMLGYWRQPEETKKTMRNGWLLTGDIGFRDADGYFFITDRKKDMLLVNGINVYPREIEEVLYQFPGVREAAVVGRPDPRKGEQAIAFVSANDGIQLQENVIQAFLREKLADYKVPRKILFLPSLPRTATGKILKTSLRDMAI